jgi:DNA repair exonuclease SbcCD ATPase subunit
MTEQSKGGQVPPYVELAVHYKAEIDATAAERDRLRERVTEYRRRLESYADQVTDLMEQLGQLSTLQAEAARLREALADIYEAAKSQVDKGDPLLNSHWAMTTSRAALASSATPECAHCGHPAHERYCTADECQCAFFATPERKP